MSTEHPVDVGDLIAEWPGDHALALADGDRLLAAAGDLAAPRRIASITKLFTAYAGLVAVEEGTIDLDDPAGPPGSTVRHLLAHASGLPFEGDEPVAPVGERRIYSNTGIELFADHLAHRAAMPFADYLRIGVLEPLDLGHLRAEVNPAHGLHASVLDLIVFGRELLSPTLIDPTTLTQATSPVWPDLRGVLPGFGSMHPNPWGLGFEIRGTKAPHWTAPTHPPSTFGHFGGAGSFLWIDPIAARVGATVGSEPFGEWAVAAWAPANQAMLDRVGPALP